MIALQTKPNLLRRFIAGLIDYTLVIGFFYAYIFSFGTPDTDGEYTIKGQLALVPMLFWFILIILTEVFLGATLGNSIVGLKPRSLTKISGELSIGQSIRRHLLDGIDMFPFGLIGIITITKTDRNQRLGDIWAETIVEIDQK